jgi:hypothetical protein
MPTRLTLTLLLILLAAVIAAAAIFFLLARSGPPGDTGAGSPSPAPPGAEPAAGPRLTIVAESIVDKGTGQALSADVYLNGALLRSLGKSVLRPQHYTAKRHCAANWETNEFSLTESHSLYSKFVAEYRFAV